VKNPQEPLWNILHYYIVGTSHNLQNESPFRTTQDTRLRDKLAEIIGTHPVVLIAEEVDANEEHKQIIYGRNLAADHDPKIPWVSLDMTTPQLKNAGIWDELEAAAHLTEDACRNRKNEIYHPVRANDMREACWLERIRVACDAYKLTSGTVLITCGRMHLESLADKASKCGIRNLVLEVPLGLKQTLGEIKLLP
jgi:hypothetical protein